jgi:hypothetical protein
MNVVKESLALLGQSMRDRVTGFTGMVSSVCFDAYGCVQAILTPAIGKDGKIGEGHWFDVKRLEPKGKRLLAAPHLDVVFGSEAGAAEKPVRHESPLPR